MWEQLHLSVAILTHIVCVRLDLWKVTTSCNGMLDVIIHLCSNYDLDKPHLKSLHVWIIKSNYFTHILSYIFTSKEASDLFWVMWLQTYVLFYTRCKLFAHQSSSKRTYMAKQHAQEAVLVEGCGWEPESRCCFLYPYWLSSSSLWYHNDAVSSLQNSYSTHLAAGP